MKKKSTYDQVELPPLPLLFGKDKLIDDIKSTDTTESNK